MGMLPKPVWGWFSQSGVCELQKVRKIGEGGVIAKCYFKSQNARTEVLPKCNLVKRGKTDSKDYTEKSALTTSGARTRKPVSATHAQTPKRGCPNKDLNPILNCSAACTPPSSLLAVHPRQLLPAEQGLNREGN